MTQGNWRKLTVTPPLAIQAGDQLQLSADESSLEQWRGATLIATRTLTYPGSVVQPEPAAQAESISELFYFRSTPMPGQQVTVTKVQENQTTGAVTFSFSSGNNTEFADWDAVGAVADSCDAVPDMCEKLLVLKSFRASPDGANKTSQVGAGVSINGLADTPVVYTEPT